MYLLRDLLLLYEVGYLIELGVRIGSAMGRSLDDLDSCIVSVLIIRKIYNFLISSIDYGSGESFRPFCNLFARFFTELYVLLRKISRKGQKKKFSKI